MRRPTYPHAGLGWKRIATPHEIAAPSCQGPERRKDQGAARDPPVRERGAARAVLSRPAAPPISAAPPIPEGRPRPGSGCGAGRPASEPPTCRSAFPLDSALPWPQWNRAGRRPRAAGRRPNSESPRAIERLQPLNEWVPVPMAGGEEESWRLSVDPKLSSLRPGTQPPPRDASRAASRAGRCKSWSSRPTRPAGSLAPPRTRAFSPRHGVAAHP